VPASLTLFDLHPDCTPPPFGDDGRQGTAGDSALGGKTSNVQTYWAAWRLDGCVVGGFGSGHSSGRTRTGRCPSDTTRRPFLPDGSGRNMNPLRVKTIATSLSAHGARNVARDKARQSCGITTVASGTKMTNVVPWQGCGPRSLKPPLPKTTCADVA
jgi:hypothetical protein